MTSFSHLHSPLTPLQITFLSSREHFTIHCATPCYEIPPQKFISSSECFPGLASRVGITSFMKHDSSQVRFRRDRILLAASVQQVISVHFSIKKQKVTGQLERQVID